MLASNLTTKVAEAFTNQSIIFDEIDNNNPLLLKLRTQVRGHVCNYLKDGDSLLELNAGTGLDALYFTKKFKIKIHAIDISEGMLHQFNQKIIKENQEVNITTQHLSYLNINELSYRNFDYVFSNFGGLNCTSKLNNVMNQLPQILKPGAILTFVIMPPFCPWEILWIFRSNFKKAFRRFKKGGSDSIVENTVFKTWYYSYFSLKKMLGKQFKPLDVESMSLVFPPPQSTKFAKKYPKLLLTLEKVDKIIRHIPPFKKWGDHYIASFQFNP